ncbi:TetR/AcrR family transcriptional regulator [Parvularcula marina]|uniref:TetR/AcrR family transcriptional regulator n=1 Tax=Parvularcula marina TaxID=2292771 RepID=A0A371RHL6_9PROT|nr:TetR/AcrR family transcriptional regulator [Parvularcula marina]RFB04947.1 TetR/AcrR family transcriptional regulator [Parvularcula marina]
MSSDDLNPTRKKILEATWKLLEANPARVVPMSEIAKTSGISRQAVYLHFPTRAELLIAVTRYTGDQLKVDELLAPSRAAETGEARLAAYIDFWATFIPQIYGVMKALLVMRDSDEAARAAWDDRMAAFREGCEAAVKSLKRDGRLRAGLTVPVATDLLWTWMSVRNWEHLTIDCGWPQARYRKMMQETARQLLICESD